LSGWLYRHRVFSPFAKEIALLPNLCVQECLTAVPLFLQLSFIWGASGGSRKTPKSITCDVRTWPCRLRGRALAYYRLSPAPAMQRRQHFRDTVGEAAREFRSWSKRSGPVEMAFASNLHYHAGDYSDRSLREPRKNNGLTAARSEKKSWRQPVVLSFTPPVKFYPGHIIEQLGQRGQGSPMALANPKIPGCRVIVENPLAGALPRTKGADKKSPMCFLEEHKVYRIESLPPAKTMFRNFSFPRFGKRHLRTPRTPQLTSIPCSLLIRAGETARRLGSVAAVFNEKRARVLFAT